MKANFIHVCFVVDSSGSMATSIDDVKGGFKKIIEEQKANTKGECAVSYFDFNSKVTEVYRGKNVKDINSTLEYIPSGMTALMDGVGIAIDTIGKWLNSMSEDEKPEQNLIVIITDGGENFSKEYSASRVREMIKHQQDKYSWNFIFLGADLTNVKDAIDLGIKTRGITTKRTLGKSYDIVNSSLSLYRNVNGTKDQKLATMNAYLCSSVDAMNDDYQKATGIKVD